MDLADSKSQLGVEPVLENSENANLRPYTALSNTMAASHTATALDSTQAVFHGSGVQHTGKGHFNVQGNLNIMSNPPSDPKEEVEKCMKALFVTDPSEDRAMLKRKKGNRASGTCEWILKSEKLNTWLDFEETEQKSQSTSVLWLRGNPGTGKSTMAIFLTEKLSIDFKAMENMTLAYFFCDASFEKQKTATSIIRGLLYLLVQKHKNLLSKYILPKYKERGDQLFTSFDALWRVFLATAADQDTGQKYCIIDALDECDNDSKAILLCQLHDTFHCQEESPPNLSILITSRPYPEIREYLQDFTNADLASFPEARGDIEICIKERVDDLVKKKNYTDKVKREIIDLLRSKAEGTFLWVGLACEELRGKPSKDAIQFLRDMPKGLISLYANLLKTATEDETSECMAIRRILSFVVVSFRVLSVLELSEACQLHLDETDPDTRLLYTRDQISSCRLLVVVCDEKVQLLHQSVRDFLTGSGSSFCIEKVEAHASAASRCIGNLIEQLHGEIKLEGPFLKYAECYWTEHVRQAKEKFKLCEPHIPFFQKTSTSRQRWVQKRYFGYAQNHSFLSVAVIFGLPTLIKYALGMRKVHPIMGGPAFSIKNDINQLDDGGESPLSLALRSILIDEETRAQIVDMLLKAGAAVTGKDGNAAIRAYWIHQEAVLSLLGHMHPETRKECIQRLLREGEGDYKVMPLLLAHYGDQITVEKEILWNTVSSSTGMRILPFLLDQRRAQITITEDIMERAAGNAEQGSELVEFLLNYQGDQILVTENTVLAAMDNKRQGQKIMQRLCQHQSSRITITTKMLEAAVVQEQSSKFVELLLLKYRGSQILVTENIILVAMDNVQQGKRIIELLCQHQSGKITVTTNILESAVGLEEGRELLELLLQHRGDQPTITITKIMLYLGTINYRRAREIISFIFQELGNSINYLDMIIMAITRHWASEKFIEFLIQEGGSHIVITDEIVEAMLDANSPLGCERQIACMKLFFEYRRKLKFSGKALAIIHKFRQRQISKCKKRKLSRYEEESYYETTGECVEPLFEE